VPACPLVVAWGRVGGAPLRLLPTKRAMGLSRVRIPMHLPDDLFREIYRAGNRQWEMSACDLMESQSAAVFLQRGVRPRGTVGAGSWGRGHVGGCTVGWGALHDCCRLGRWALLVILCMLGL
jgi:hypothetical protein